MAGSEDHHAAGAESSPAPQSASPLTSATTAAASATPSAVTPTTATSTVLPRSPPQRSPSRTSGSSKRSQKNKPGRPSRMRKRHSTASDTSEVTTDLTFFATFPVDGSPEGFRGEPALNNSLSQALISEGGDRGKTKATLAGLTDAGPQIYGRSALFDDSISIRDVPGSLHLATDDHIERMIARTGAVKLIRQFARDLAMRDAEISSFRVRADQRERELKKMLREANITNQAIEHRLYMMESDSRSESDQNPNGPVKQSLIDRMMNEAMDTDASAALSDTVDVSADNMTTSPTLTGDDSGSATPLAQTNRTNSIGRWGEFIWGSKGKQSSRGSSVEPDERSQSTLKNNNDIQPTHSPEKQTPNDATATSIGTSKSPGDDSSIKSKDSKRSWTKLFGGGGSTAPPVDKSTAKPDTSGTRTPSQGSKDVVSSPNEIPPNATPSAIAVMKRMTGGSGVQPLSSGTRNKELASSRKPAVKPAVSTNSRKPAPKTTAVTTRSQRATKKSVSEPPSITSSTESTNNGPVEMDAILPLEFKPPALNPFHRLQEPGGPLTDRFGFIYDQKRKTRQRQADVSDQHEEDQLSRSERLNVAVQDTGRCEPLEQAGKPDPSSTPTKTEDSEGGLLSGRKWQNYLKTATTPTELLSHTPVPDHVGSEVLPPKTSKQGRKVKSRHPSVCIDKNQSISLASSTSSSGQTVTSQACAQAYMKPLTSGSKAKDSEPVKLLLERLTDLHDILQEERTVKWNEFLRKVRAERRKDNEAATGTTSAEQRATMTTLATPEASLADGEVVGIAGLGNKGKVGRAKWQEFRRLVLGGIPVSYRAKIWSECSGASALRVPGLYDELVKRDNGADADPSIINQIETDIHRTLTDNIFFRKGPGVQKLKEVLLAYSRRNPEIGY
ncbi:hypothetical protein KEM54_001371, partial [Ascosphaera aggregata]